MEQEFVKSVNAEIANKVTPLYNIYLCVAAAFFAFIVMTKGDDKCLVKDGKVTTEDDFSNVAKLFYLESAAGLVLALVSVLLYHMQSKSMQMYDVMRPYVIFSNLIFLIWFIAVQVTRFGQNGEACSKNIQGHIIFYYIVSQYVVYLG